MPCLIKKIFNFGLLLILVSLFVGGNLAFASTNSSLVNVNHPHQGELPKILTDVAYDVDSSQSFSLAYTRYRIESAQALAQANSSGLGLYEKFHFWPNIFNLTEIYYGDQTLYTRILNEILANQVNQSAIISQINDEVQQGNRVFLARDFISNVEYAGQTYYELHYAFIINLDKKYVREILVHREPSLGPLHDPHIDNLTSVFNSQTAPLGESWELCLRGNLKSDKYNAIIVDKLGQSPQTEFFIARVHLTCGQSYVKEELPLAPSLLPLPNPPANPPSEKEIPPKPNNPKHPQPPVITGNPPNDSVLTPAPPVRPWPFGYKENEYPSADAGQSASQPAGAQSTSPNCPESQSDLAYKRELLVQLKEQFEKEKEEYQTDVELINQEFTCYPGQWGDEAVFKHPCLQEIYEKYNQQVQKLKQQIKALRKEAAELSNKIEALKKQISIIVDALFYRESFWENMLTVNGEWAKLTEPCGGGILLPGHSSASPSKLDVPVEQQTKFQRDVARALMAGKTWDQAVAEAIEKNIPQPNESWSQGWDESVWRYVWETYANCLKRLYTKQLRVYLGQIYPNASEEEIEQMIEVMFNGRSALTASQQEEFDEMIKRIKELREQIKEKDKQVNELEYQINDLRRQFRQEIKDKCLNHLWKELEQTRQAIWILEAFLAYCQNQSGQYEFSYVKHSTLCATLQSMLSNPVYNRNQGLKDFLKLLLSQHCQDQELALPATQDEQLQDIIDKLKITEFPEEFDAEDVETIKEAAAWLSQPENKDKTLADYVQATGRPVKEDYKPIIQGILNNTSTAPKENLDSPTDRNNLTATSNLSPEKYNQVLPKKLLKTTWPYYVLAVLAIVSAAVYWHFRVRR